MEAIFAQVLAFKIVNNYIWRISNRQKIVLTTLFSFHLILQTGFNGLFLGKPGKGVQHFPGGGGGGATFSRGGFLSFKLEHYDSGGG